MEIILLENNSCKFLCVTDKPVGIGEQDILNIDGKHYRLVIEKGNKLGVRQINLNFNCKSIKDKEVVCPMCGKTVREMVEYDRNKGTTHCSTCKADLKFYKTIDGNYITQILKRPNILKI